MLERTPPEERLAAALARKTALQVASTKLKKLAAGLAPLTLADNTAARKIALLKKASVYASSIQENLPLLKKTFRPVHNELKSFRDGVQAGVATTADLQPRAVLMASAVLDEKVARLDVLIAQLQASGTSPHADQNQKIVERNRVFRERLPNLQGSSEEFAMARMPIVFTFQNKQKHSSVGYVSVDKLDMLGFKVENFAGYTIIHNQLVIGVNHNAIRVAEMKDGKVVTDDKGRIQKKLERVDDSAVTFKGGKPVKVGVRRDKTLKDVAEAIVRDLNRQTKKAYALVSPLPESTNGAGWFWVMPAADLKRLAAGMPGNHVGIAKWGFGS